MLWWLTLLVLIFCFWKKMSLMYGWNQTVPSIQVNNKNKLGLSLGKSFPFTT